MVQKIIKHHDDNGDYISVECSGMGIQLYDKRLTSYKVESKPASQILNDVLVGTTWSVGSIDASFDLMFRSMDYTGNVLDAISQISDTFGALVIWNTSQRKVHLYKPNSYCRNRGIEIARDKLLKSIELEHDNALFCTRLYVYGKDGLTINGVNPIGGAYLENFSYFIYPFDRDEHGNVIKHSAYGMSDSLCAALIDYTNLKNANQNNYEGLLAELNGLQSQALVKNGELDDLKTELNKIFDKLSTINSTGVGDLISTINQRTVLEAQITSKNNEIASILNSINVVNGNIYNLHDLLSIENNLTSEQLLELSDYVLEGDFNNEFVSDAKQLMELAIEDFNSRIEPQILAKISIVNLFEIYEYQDSSDLDKFELGEIINIKYDTSNIDIKATITELVFDFENRDIEVTISNITKGKSESDEWAKKINTSYGNSNTFAQQKWAYDNAVNKTDEVSQILSNTWSAIDREIAGGLNNSVSISRRGIINSSVDDPQRMTIIQNSVIALSKDGGNHWATALTPDGIIGERIMGQIIAGNNLIITNSSGSVRVDSNGMNVTNMNLTLTRSDNKSRISMSPNDGIRIQKSTNSGSTWFDSLYMDIDGGLVLENIVTRGNITAQGTISGGIITGASFNFGNITGTIITGSTIQTSISAYPRAVMSSSSHTFGVHSSASDRIEILPDGFGQSMLRFDNSIIRSYLSNSINDFMCTSTGNIRIGSTYDLYLTSSSGYVKFVGWDSIYNTLNNTTLGSILSTLTDQLASLNTQMTSANSNISSLWSAMAGKASVYHTHSVSIPDHNHGNPDNVNSGGGTFTVA